MVLVSAVFFLVYPLTQRQAEQSPEFLRDLGALAVRARGKVCKTIQLGVPSLFQVSDFSRFLAEFLGAFDDSQL